MPVQSGIDLLSNAVCSMPGIFSEGSLDDNGRLIDTGEETSFHQALA
jgi:hypothetical protein